MVVWRKSTEEVGMRNNLHPRLILLLKTTQRWLSLLTGFNKVSFKNIIFNSIGHCSIWMQLIWTTFESLGHLETISFSAIAYSCPYLPGVCRFTMGIPSGVTNRGHGWLVRGKARGRSYWSLEVIWVAWRKGHHFWKKAFWGFSKCVIYWTVF